MRTEHSDSAEHVGLHIMAFSTRELSLNWAKECSLIYRSILMNTFLLSPKCLLERTTPTISIPNLLGLLFSVGHSKVNP